ncbi:hypothetical protein BEL01nite_49590 [Bradyrhizobium elkanii]|nr:hypothetical protein BEL01nite_49590 [Bradyrhizobium elkanii]
MSEATSGRISPPGYNFPGYRFAHPGYKSANPPAQLCGPRAASPLFLPRANEKLVARMEPTGRANARPMTGSAESGTAEAMDELAPDFAALHPGYATSRLAQEKSPGGMAGAWI